MKKQMSKQLILAVLGVALAGAAAAGTARIWGGDGDGVSWSDGSNWSPAGVPQEGDSVKVGAGATVLLAQSTEALTAFTMSGGSLIFSNWTTRLVADEIALNGGSITHAVCDTNATPGNISRVHIECVNLYVAASAAINVAEKGYRGALDAGKYGQGSGGSRDYGGASHGGHGGVGAIATHTGPIYGSYLAPVDPGSGGGARAVNEPGGHGGGAVRIEATGRVVLNGTINADGQAVVRNNGGGAGGSIFITCETFVATNGTLRAQGGNTRQSGGTGYGGGGGRIAVVYDLVEQALLNQMTSPRINILLGGGYGASGSRYGMPGTLYLSDAGFYPPASNILKGGALLIEGFDQWSANSLTVDSGRLVLPPGFELNVANDLVISGVGAGLETSNATIVVGGDFVVGSLQPTFLYGGGNSSLDVSGSLLVNAGEFHWHGAQDPASLLRVGADCIVTNNATLSLYAAATNGISELPGARVEVGGTLIVYTNSWLMPYSQPTNGGSVFMATRVVELKSGGGIDADAKGFGAPGWNDPPALTVKPGYGPGAGRDMTGGGHGGLGGAKATGVRTGGAINDCERHPKYPGSGGATYGGDAGGRGGGLVWLFVEKTLTINGEIRARGNTTPTNPYKIDVGGGGAGGGIYLRSRRLEGNGAIMADGGVSNYERAGGSGGGSGGSGGGGRVALWQQIDNFTGIVSVEPGLAYDAARTGTAGTIFKGLIAAPGTLMILR